VVCGPHPRDYTSTDSTYGIDKAIGEGCTTPAPEHAPRLQAVKRFEVIDFVCFGLLVIIVGLCALLLYADMG